MSTPRFSKKRLPLLPDRSSRLGWFALAFLFLASAPLAPAQAQGAAGSASDPVPASRPQLELQIGHMGAVWAVAFTSGGQTLVSAGDDGSRLWDVATGALQWAWTAASSRGRMLALSPDGGLLASSFGRGLTLWETGTGTSPRTLLADGVPIVSAAFAPDGKTLAGGSHDGAVKLWELRTGAVLHALPAAQGPASLAFAPDGTMLARGSGSAVELWDPRTGQRLRTQAVPGPVTAVAFSPDGETLAFAGGARGTAAEVSLWNARTGALLRRLRVPSGPVRSLAFSRDGKMLAGAIGAPDGGVGIWDRETGALQKTLVVGAERTVCLGVAFSPDGRTIAAGTTAGLVQLWDARTGTLRRSLGRRDPILSVAVSPDGSLIASGGTDSAIRLWDARTGMLWRTLVGHIRPVRAVLFSPDGKSLASASRDGVVKLWDAQTGAVRVTLPGIRGPVSLAFAPDGTTLVRGTGSAVELWDARAGTLRRSFQVRPRGVLCIALSPDGKTLAAGGRDGAVALWDVATGQLLRSLPGPPGPMTALEFSPDGSAVAGATFGPSGQVRLWDLPSGTLRRTFKMPSLFVAFSPDSQTLATLSNLRIVRLWNARTGAPQRALIGHAHWVSAAAFFPDGKRIATVGWDQTLRVWSIRSGGLLATMVPLPPSSEGEIGMDWLTVTPEGYYRGSPGAGRFIRWQAGSDRFPVEAYAPIFNRPGLVRRALSGAGIPLTPQVRRFLTGQAIPPRVEFPGLQDHQMVTGDAVRVELAVTDERRVSRIEWRIDGRAVDAKPIDVGAKVIDVGAKAIDVGAKAIDAGAKAIAAHRILQRFRAEVPLPAGESEVTLRATAFDEDGLQGWAVIRLTCPGSAPAGAPPSFAGYRPGGGDLYVLAVGISRYRNPKYDLRYAAADARAFAALWPRTEGTLYHRVLVTTLPDSEATAAKIAAALAHLREQATSRDSIVLFLSGHGIQVGDGQFYFASQEVDAATSAQIEKTALPWTALQTALAKAPAHRVFLFLDACHSGGVLGEQMASSDELAEALVRRAGVLVFSSSRGNEVSYEEESLGHGAFTAALLEGIGEGKADLEINGQRDGAITAEELLAYLRARVPQMTANRQTPTCPLIYDFGEAFLLARAP